MLNGLLGPALEQFKAEAAGLLRDYPPEFIVNTIASAGIKFMLERAMEAGPSESFALKFNLSPDQAKTIYESVLKDALTRA
jgi:hypothetical protein